MKKLYEDPLIEIRNYALPPRDVVMTSDISGRDGDDGTGSGIDNPPEYDYFG